ncbi:uncharacterized protein ACOB8E_002389 isoform 2-T2 [Sarcophilus harrisii]
MQGGRLRRQDPSFGIRVAVQFFIHSPAISFPFLGLTASLSSFGRRSRGSTSKLEAMFTALKSEPLQSPSTDSEFGVRPSWERGRGEQGPWRKCGSPAGSRAAQRTTPATPRGRAQARGRRGTALGKLILQMRK